MLFSRLDLSQDNSLSVTSKLLKQLEVPVTDSTLSKKLKEHPDHPSMLSISDALTDLRVESLALKTSFNELHKLPLPFIAVHEKGKKEYFTLVSRISDTEDVDFGSTWTGKVLLADPLDNAGEVKYKESRKQENFDNAITDAVFLTLVALWLIPSALGLSQKGWRMLPDVLLYTLKFAGTITCMLLLWYEMDEHNPFLQKVCSGGAKTNCRAILQSGQSKLLGVLSWSAIGFGYFSGGFLAILFSNFSPAVVDWLSILNVLALPYTAFSIYYQWQVAKQWCVLCLFVQTLLVFEFALSLIARTTTSHFLSLARSIRPEQALVIIASLSLPLLGWLVLRRYLHQAKEAGHYRRELLRMKSDARIFESLLEKQPNIGHSTEGLGITLGNPDAKYKIVKVCNPYCGPCARAHSVIEDILHQNDNVSLQIIFNAAPDFKDRRFYPVSHLLAISCKNDPGLTSRALDDWYTPPIKDYARFSDKYKINGELARQQEKIAAMQNWCRDEMITVTPTFFINGYKLPGIYRVEDIKYLLLD
jgi:uncharacterized membrane protein